MSEEQENRDGLSDEEYAQVGKMVYDSLRALILLHRTQKVFMTLTVKDEKLFVLDCGRISMGKEIVSSYGEMYNDVEEEGDVGGVGLPALNKPAYFG